MHFIERVGQIKGVVCITTLLELDIIGHQNGMHFDLGNYVV